MFNVTIIDSIQYQKATALPFQDISTDSFVDIYEILKIFSTIEVEEKQNAAGYNGAKFKEGFSRSIENVDYQTLLIYDFDQDTDVNQLKLIPYNKILYKTYSWTPEKQKYRMIIEINEPIYKQEIFKEAYAFIGKLLLSMGLEYDKACNDFARYYYVPAINKNNGYSSDIELHMTNIVFDITQFKEIEVKPKTVTKLQNTNAQTNSNSSRGYFNTLYDTDYFINKNKVINRVNEYYAMTSDHHTGIYRLACSVYGSYKAKYKHNMEFHELLTVMEYIDHQDSNGFAANHGKTDGSKRINCKDTVINAVRSVIKDMP